MRKSTSVAVSVFLIIFGGGIGLAVALYNATDHNISIWILVIAFVLALFCSLAIKFADQWERIVILHLGKFFSLKGPGEVFCFRSNN